MTAATAARGTMLLSDHVREMRTRAVRAAVALLVGILAGYLLSDQILDVLRSPIDEIAHYRQASLNYDTVTGAFDLKLKIALFTGVLLASPVWLVEAFGFAMPGMTAREKKYTVGFALSGISLFAAGVTFGFLLFPQMVRLLAGLSSTEDATILTATYYVDFVMKIVLATGVAFVLPVFVVLLNFLDLVSAKTIRRSWRVIVVGIALFSALVTPAADVLSMFLVAVPMSILFAGALAITQIRDSRAHRRAAAAETATLSAERQGNAQCSV
ncbi:twin-arginine translocase subunit TatC [Dietzia sp. 179-F 9C3 NHS]|uniref:twin-arginine translocase subunit TatC n=1 Tax=Dietzia sp. 179-F 9C3 NHS TaxID=3374295 RepID=UPI003879182A